MNEAHQIVDARVGFAGHPVVFSRSEVAPFIVVAEVPPGSFVDSNGAPIGIDGVGVSYSEPRCGCTSIAFGPPEVVLPGDDCPIPPWASWRLEGEGDLEQMTAEVEPKVRLTFAGECVARVRPRPPETARALEMRVISPEAMDFKLELRLGSGTCGGMVPSPDGTELWVALGEAGFARCGADGCIQVDSVTRGLPADLAHLSRSGGVFLAIDSHSRVYRGLPSELVYGAPGERSRWVSAVVSDEAGWWVFESNPFRLSRVSDDGGVEEVPFPGFLSTEQVSGAEWDDASGELLVVGFDEVSGQPFVRSLRLADRIFESISIAGASLRAVAQVSPGVFVAAGDRGPEGHGRLVRVTRAGVVEVEVLFDDPFVDESARSGGSCYSPHPPSSPAPNAFVSVSATMGVVYAVGCDGSLVRVSPFGARPTGVSIALPDELVTTPRDLRTASLELQHVKLYSPRDILIGLEESHESESPRLVRVAIERVSGRTDGLIADVLESNGSPSPAIGLHPGVIVGIHGTPDEPLVTMGKRSDLPLGSVVAIAERPEVIRFDNEVTASSDRGEQVLIGGWSGFLAIVRPR